MAVQREYLSPNEIAELLGVSAFTIRRYIKLGELRAVKLLGGFRVHQDDLRAFLKAHEVNPAEEDPDEESPLPAETARPPSPPPSASLPESLRRPPAHSPAPAESRAHPAAPASRKSAARKKGRR